MREDKIEAIKTARETIGLRTVYLDTETTGLDDGAEICDIAIIDHDGTVLLDTLVRPTKPIPVKASEIHGIINEDIMDAPNYAEIHQNLEAQIEGKLIVIYNASYDTRILRQSAWAHKLPRLKDGNAVCAMELYAQFYGDWNEYHGSYKWQSQANAAQQLGIEIPADLHRAAADANLCRLIIEAMAATPLPGEATQSSQLFIESFTSLAQYAHDLARRKGFWDTWQSNDRIIALLHTEVSEAYEALRKGDLRDNKIPEFTSFEIELADLVIRILDFSAARELPLAEAIIAKLAYNETRPHKHGKKF